MSGILCCPGTSLSFFFVLLQCIYYFNVSLLGVIMLWVSFSSYYLVKKCLFSYFVSTELRLFIAEGFWLINI